MAKVELARTLSIPAAQAWEHVCDLEALGDWLALHQGWRGPVPDEVVEGVVVVGVVGAKGLRNRVTWRVTHVDPPRRIDVSGEGVGGTRYGLTMSVSAAPEGARLAVRIDLGGRPLFGPIGAAAARAVRGDIEQSVRRFEELYG